ncbi:LacI family DNA-binding transcriptional regulator [Sulfitobacter pontiacus]|uniref:LacI family DNA-binding transcriptional regulator n=1 Tax=Sulfitobacter pontiacus TaxID=60137 RepID=UPI0004517FD0|nr:LacI family DNA-binding transcriptional regulator [Sulfitobacter pontiacus]KAJ30214.1 transcriptional regulator [Sulfitobacter pontiacus 3SOLIMAR09]
MEKNTKYKRVTLNEVAAEAGVSAITVSRTIRAPNMVSAGVRKKVQAAIELLGYVPDQAASALASERTNVVGLLVPSLTNAVFSDVLRGVYDVIEGSGLSVQIGNFRYSPSKEENLLRTFLRQRPAGLIVAGIDQTDAARTLLKSAPCPVVQIMDVSDSPIDLMIGFSHYDGAVEGTRHLIDAGYKKTGFLGARMDPRSQARLAGFTAEAQARGLYDPTRVITTTHPSSVGMGGQLLSDLLAQAPDTDAVFCNNDDLAAGALFEAERRRINVPNDLGICGFNDLEMSRHLNPGITSVATPRYEVGAGAMTLLRDAIADRADIQTPHIRLGVELIKRGSTRRGYPRE